MSIKTFSHAGETQDAAIMALFRRRPTRRLSPSQVLFNSGLVATPITSVRRSMSNLTKAGLLERTQFTVPGPYGRDESQWQLAR